MSDELPPRAFLRASDADRERVVERLRLHASEGRLDLEELGERIGSCLSAKTYGELDALTSDLPDLPRLAPHQPLWRNRLALRGSEFVAFDLFFVIIWAVTSHGGGFWAGWILLVSAIVFVRFTVHELLGREDPGEHAERRSA